MATSNIECKSGGKFPKKPLRRVRSSPYGRPLLKDGGFYRQMPVAETGGRGWFSKVLDSAARVFSFVSSSLFGKGIGVSSGEDITATINKYVPKEKSSPEVKMQKESMINITISIHCDGSQTSKQELISRIVTILELEQQNNQIDEEIIETPAEIGSPEEIARAYLRSKAQKAPPGIGLQHKICNRNKSSRNRFAKALLTTKSISPTTSDEVYQNNSMIWKAIAHKAYQDRYKFREILRKPRRQIQNARSQDART